MTAADCTLDLFDCSCPTCSELWTETINAAQAAHKETEMKDQPNAETFEAYDAAIAKLTWARLDSKLQAGFYAVLDGTLLWAPMLADGSIDLEDDGQVNAGEVSCIETQAELDEINALLGTAYLMAGFPGR